jgi:hypothetical protein
MVKADNNLVAVLGEKNLLWSPGRRWRDNIKKDLKEILHHRQNPSNFENFLTS